MRKYVILMSVVLLLMFCVGCTLPENPSADTMLDTLVEEVESEQATDFATEGVTEAPTEAITEAETEVTIAVLPGITDTEEDGYRVAYQKAHNRQLKGTPVVVLLFMDDSVSTWSALDVRDFRRENVLPALAFLEENAKAWGVDLKFQVETYAACLGDVGIKYDGRVNPDLSNGGSTKDILDHAAKYFGLEDNWWLYSYFKDKYPNDEIIFMTFFNKPGKSYTRHAVSTGYLAYAEHSVLFAYDYGTGYRQNYRTGCRASQVVHELLHLYGAEDLYNPPSREMLAEQYYHTDIMNWQFDRLGDNTLEQCTAFSIGWTNEVPSVFFEDGWWE